METTKRGANKPRTHIDRRCPINTEWKKCCKHVLDKYNAGIKCSVILKYVTTNLCIGFSTLLCFYTRTLILFFMFFFFSFAFSSSRLFCIPAQGTLFFVRLIFSTLFLKRFTKLVRLVSVNKLMNDFLQCFSSKLVARCSSSFYERVVLQRRRDSSGGKDRMARGGRKSTFLTSHRIRKVEKLWNCVRVKRYTRCFLLALFSLSLFFFEGVSYVVLSFYTGSMKVLARESVFVGGFPELRGSRWSRSIVIS